ncbi:hypothetical protein [Arthrobacter sp. zg-Y769]|uniref:hypothetical protein n=1 Tax=Arthrobacter sp. zg-Y769 TaxID=2894191 RepID=UPI001E642125|nr:hypothetical protein [Arthrobacter sp. zg-Y769]MCC9204547.1 hypothetical protein [Arthrobacter sp. zg-Y769]
MPNNTPSAAEQASGGDSHGQPAAVVFDDLIGMAADAVSATGTSGWTYENGTIWAPEEPVIAFSPEPCGRTADGMEQRFMEFGLIGPPAPVGPGEARDQMRAYLQDHGYELTRSMDPPAGNEPKNTYIVTGKRADGAFIDYGANDAEQLLTLRSQCSAHPTLQDEVSAQTE